MSLQAALLASCRRRRRCEIAARRFGTCPGDCPLGLSLSVRSLAVLGSESDPEADEDRAGDEVEHAAGARAAEEVADARDREHVDRQPRQADEAEEHAEQDERAEARRVRRRELREEAREE